MWTYNNKQILIAINTESIQHIQFDDGTELKGFNAIKSFKRGIFVNPNLNKKKYLSLLKIFHPDVSNLNVDLATRIAIVIISAKDGTATAVNPKKTGYYSQSGTDTKTSTSTSSNYYSWWQQSNWSEWTNSDRQHSSHRSHWQQERTRNERTRQKSQQSRPKKDFETWLNYVPPHKHALPKIAKYKIAVF